MQGENGAAGGAKEVVCSVGEKCLFVFKYFACLCIGMFV